jgi:hypothetical protein
MAQFTVIIMWLSERAPPSNHNVFVAEGHITVRGT